MILVSYWHLDFCVHALKLKHVGEKIFKNRVLILLLLSSPLGKTTCVVCYLWTLLHRVPCTFARWSGSKESYQMGYNCTVCPLVFCFSLNTLILQFWSDSVQAFIHSYIMLAVIIIFFSWLAVYYSRWLLKSAGNGLQTNKNHPTVHIPLEKYNSKS